MGERGEEEDALIIQDPSRLVVNLSIGSQQCWTGSRSRRRSVILEVAAGSELLDPHLLIVVIEHQLIHSIAKLSWQLEKGEAGVVHLLQQLQASCSPDHVGALLRELTQLIIASGAVVWPDE